MEARLASVINPAAKVALAGRRRDRINEFWRKAEREAAHPNGRCATLLIGQRFGRGPNQGSAATESSGNAALGAENGRRA